MGSFLVARPTRATSSKKAAKKAAKVSLLPVAGKKAAQSEELTPVAQIVQAVRSLLAKVGKEDAHILIDELS